MIHCRGSVLRAPTLHLCGEYHVLRRRLRLFVIMGENGVWRSLVARTPGGREVIGSNPVTPTNTIEIVYLGSHRVLAVLLCAGEYLDWSFQLLPLKSHCKTSKKCQNT